MNSYNDFDEVFKEKEIKYKCPLCLSEDIEDISTYNSNGVYGPGFHSYKVSDFRCCKNCGIIFKPTNNNKL
jgi:hypothetical protein